jgi:hypothetical protein
MPAVPGLAHGPLVQTKLRVGGADDPAEADRVAGAVLRYLRSSRPAIGTVEADGLEEGEPAGGAGAGAVLRRTIDAGAGAHDLSPGSDRVGGPGTCGRR